MISMEDEKPLSFYLTYLGLFLLSGLLAAISAVFAEHNPVGGLLLGLTRPLVALSGVVPSALNSGAFAAKLILNLIWPLTLLPLQLVTMQGLKWRLWQFLLFWFGFNLVLAFAVQRVDLGL